MNNKPETSKETKEFIENLHRNPPTFGKRLSPDEVREQQAKLDKDFNFDEKEPRPALQKLSYLIARLLDAVIIIMGIGFLLVALWGYWIFREYQTAGSIGAIFQNKYLYYSIAYIAVFVFAKIINSKLYKYHFR